jgi:hypothetical protein
MKPSAAASDRVSFLIDHGFTIAVSLLEKSKQPAGGQEIRGRFRPGYFASGSVAALFDYLKSRGLYLI